MANNSSDDATALKDYAESSGLGKRPREASSESSCSELETGTFAKRGNFKAVAIKAKAVPGKKRKVEKPNDKLASWAKQAADAGPFNRWIAMEVLHQSANSDKLKQYPLPPKVAKASRHKDDISSMDTDSAINHVRQSSKKQVVRTFNALVTHPAWTKLNAEEKTKAQKLLKAKLNAFFEQECDDRVPAFIGPTSTAPLLEDSWVYQPKVQTDSVVARKMATAAKKLVQRSSPKTEGDIPLGAFEQTTLKRAHEMLTRLNNPKLSSASMVDLDRRGADKELAEQLGKFIISYGDKSLETDDDNSARIKEEPDNNAGSFLAFYEDDADTFMKHEGAQAVISEDKLVEGALSTILKDQAPPATLVRQRLVLPVFKDEPEMEGPSPSAGKDFEPLEGEASVLGISLKNSNHLVLEDTPVVTESLVKQLEHPLQVLKGGTPNEPVSSLFSMFTEEYKLQMSSL